MRRGASRLPRFDFTGFRLEACVRIGAGEARTASDAFRFRSLVVLRRVLSRLSPRKLCLIADDSVVIRTAARSILADLYFRTAEAEDGLAALSECRRNSPDAILLDHTMPYLDGMGVMEALRRRTRGPGPKIIFCTANRDPRHIADAIHAGAHEYLIKPFDRAVLTAKFEKLGLTA
jgi:two-component system, chemotaxis family, chemotaxis protein CheY